MSIPILEACKKRKRRPKLFGFHSFGDPGCPIRTTGPFRDNIRTFLQQASEVEDYNLLGMPIWCTLLVHENRSIVIPLYTIEETVEHSCRPHCDHCRCTGWSNHLITKRKYHLLIPADNAWNKPLDESVFDVQTHLLYGLIHCNGFGHLLCINGIEGGSKYLYGRELMDLWDRLCTILQTRKITVADTSKKRSMDLRLLHGVAYGHPWFGRWGYSFCHGSFGIKEHNYNRALEILSSLELERVVRDFSDTDQYQEIKQIIRLYRDMSETQLITLRDLLKFMLTVKSRAPPQKKPLLLPNPASLVTNSRPSTRTNLLNKPLLKDKPAKYKKFSTMVSSMDSRWPTRRLEFAAEVIANALKEKKEKHSTNGGMTRQDVRDAARLHIGDTGLLDYVLKSLNNVIVGDQLIRRSVNPATRILEYTIHEIGDGFKGSELAEQELRPNNFKLPIPSPALLPGNDVYNDVVFLYKHVLLDYPESDEVELAAQVILDTKHFVKESPIGDEAEELLTFIIRFVPGLVELESWEISKKIELPPREIVTVPLHATVGELKEAVENALRDSYCITEEIEVIEIDQLEDVEDSEVLFGRLESGSEIRVRGNGIGAGTKLRYQGGSDTWMVRCGCGAGDDDGERMVACDICEVWQHTRCCGIDDAETVPPLFVCSACCGSLVPCREDQPPPLSFDASAEVLFTNPPAHQYAFAIPY
ncbi:hypothetical protein UlMin_023711 [Ulmus minor]